MDGTGSDAGLGGVMISVGDGARPGGRLMLTELSYLSSVLFLEPDLTESLKIAVGCFMFGMPGLLD